MSDHSFNRLTAGIIDTCTAMQGQIKRFGTLQSALKSGHGSTLNQQVLEMMSMVRSLERSIRDNIPDGTYSIVAVNANPSPIARED